MTAHEVRSHGWYVQTGFTPTRRYKVTCTCGEHCTGWGRTEAFEQHALHVESPDFDAVFPGLADAESPWGDAP